MSLIIDRATDRLLDQFPPVPDPAYYGVLMAGNELIVVAYDLNCEMFGEPLASYPFGVDGMLEAIEYATELESHLV